MDKSIYTKDDELYMVLRYMSGVWTYDEREYRTFLSDLTLADTTVRDVAKTIEGWMAVYAIFTGNYDKLEPIWLIEHQEQLLHEFGRPRMLYVLQQVYHYKNNNGYTYIEEIEILQAVWENYKTEREI